MPRRLRRDLTHEPQPKPGGAANGERQGHGADETGGSVQDGTAGEVREFALAESEQHVTNEPHQQYE